MELTTVAPMYTNIDKLSNTSTTSAIWAFSVSLRNQSSQVKEFPAMKHANKSSLPIIETVPVRNSCHFKRDLVSMKLAHYDDLFTFTYSKSYSIDKEGFFINDLFLFGIFESFASDETDSKSNDSGK